MSLSNVAENALALLLFNNVAWAGFGDAGGILGSSVAGSLYVSLYTADPGEGANQGTNEATYTNYVRVAVVRTSSGWVVSGSAPTTVNPVSNVTFAAPGSGQVLTYFGVGTASSGAGILLGSGPLSSPITVTNGGSPPVLNNTTSITFD